ncbi:glycoside hydrolase family 73 protein [Limosilactobacillus coleohominis]|uniref:Glycoside hydrolase family 73 protein n=1 Tax=Limosilactobacillus coleohominis TaxID=181675 RepID=A0ABS2GYD8_9LACO|nr:glycoside hydrolase family 73 protein [Limosilactobacillus coleohominis]MBM6940861.1 glycoside hydrolase family 73 protein [Limosilactobacillus coleohominis]
MVNQNKKSKSIKVILPVIFTFSASLFMFHGQAHADTTTDTTQNQTTISASAGNSNGNNGNSNNNDNNEQNNNTLMIQSNSISTTATEQFDESKVAQVTNTDPTKGAVDLDQNAVKSANAKVPSEVQAIISPNNYNTSAGPQNASGQYSGTEGLNTSGLSQSQINFLASIHDGALSGWKNYGVLPSVTAAQAIIESGWGQSALSTEGHNLFGIKGSYNGQSINMMTREVYGGRSVYVNAAFRRYDNNSQSVDDHGRFLAVNSRYHNLLWQKDYRTVTSLIRQDGYATDPSYTTTLNSVIQRYNLTEWDRQAIQGVTNTGNLDDVSVHVDQLHLAGWHASNDYNSSMKHFIIIIDANTKQELYRSEVAGNYRPDVQNVYSNLKIAGWGGFDIKIPYSSNLTGHQIQVVSRYTYKTNGEPDGGQDIYFNPVDLNSNVAFLDNFDINAATNTLKVSGWHATNNSIDEPYHFIIVYDATKGQEIGRYKVDTTSRSDVANAYGIYGAGNSGFNLNIKLNNLPVNDQIQIISRYSDQLDGEGNKTDYWFAPKTFNTNNGNLDSFEIKNNKLHISGWQASDASVNQKNHFIIIYDKTKGKEIKRILVPSVNRSDVQKAYPNIANSGKSGFDITTDFDPAYAGDEIQIISRYSDQSNGEGNKTDIWFSPKTFTENDGNLDSFTANGNTLKVSGWHATDQSAGKPYHFIILYDATLGREIIRKVIASVERPDVQKAYPGVYDSEKSGFSTSFEVPGQFTGHKLQIISRYSDKPTGEGNYVDYWFSPVKFD